MLNLLIVIGLIIQALICGGLAANIASKKGYDYWTWCGCGFVFGIFGLIATVGLPLSKDVVRKRNKIEK